MSFKEPTDQMARWLEILSQYDFKIEHRAGKQHMNADALSRIPCDPCEYQCYDGQKVLSELPCGGCTTCVRRHEAWSTLIEDTVPLSVRSIQIPGESRAWGSWMLAGGLVSVVVMVVSVLLGMASTVVNSYRARTQQVECLWRGSAIPIRWLQQMWLWMGILWQRFRAGSTRPKDPLIRHIAKHGPESADSGENQPGATNWVGGYSRKDMSEMQEADSCVGKIIVWLKESKQRPDRDQVAVESPAVRHLWLQWEQLKLIDGILHKSWESTKKGVRCFQLVVPEVMQCDILEHVHNATMSGHLRLKKTYSKIQKQHHWFNVGKTASSRVFKRGLKLCHPVGTIGGCSGVPWMFSPRENTTTNAAGCYKIIRSSRVLFGGTTTKERRVYCTLSNL